MAYSFAAGPVDDSLAIPLTKQGVARLYLEVKNLCH